MGITICKDIQGVDETIYAPVLVAHVGASVVRVCVA